MNFINPLRNLRIGTRLAIGFGVLLALMALAVVGGTLMQQRSTSQLVRASHNANAKNLLATKMKSALLEAAIAMRNIGLQSDVTGTNREDDNVKQQRKLYEEALGQLTTAGLSSAEKDILNNIAELDRRMEHPLNQVVAQGLMFNNDAAAAILTKTIDPTRQLLDQINKLVQIQETAQEEALHNAIVSASTLKTLLYAIGFLGVSFGLWWAWMLTRSITQPLGAASATAGAIAQGDLSGAINASGNDETAGLTRSLSAMQEQLAAIVRQIKSASDSVNAAAGEIARGNTDLSRRSESHASSLEQTAASVEELTGTVKQNADRARQAAQLAENTSTVAGQGGHIVAEVVQTMVSINDSSRKITDIIGVIDGIAFQTNILALNAAVEAARAGEQGKGFAVVAAEVRTLAQRSADAARQIKALITASTAQIGAGSDLAGRAGKTMDGVVAAVKQVTDLITEISIASQEQSASVEQVSAAILQMDRMTQQNAAMVEQSGAAAEHVEDQARALAQAVAVFRLREDTRPTPTQRFEAMASRRAERVLPPRVAQRPEHLPH